MNQRNTSIVPRVGQVEVPTHRPEIEADRRRGAIRTCTGFTAQVMNWWVRVTWVEVRWRQVTRLRRWNARRAPQVWRHGQVVRRVPLLVCHAQRLCQGPDVVVGEAQSFYLGEFGVFGQRRQDAPERVQSRVQVVHPVTLPVVRLHSAPAALSGPLAPGPEPWWESTKKRLLWSVASVFHWAAERGWVSARAHGPGSAPDCGRHPVDRVKFNPCLFFFVSVFFCIQKTIKYLKKKTLLH